MLFTLDDFASYLPESLDNPTRAGLIKTLTEAEVYAVVPQGIADASTVAMGIALEVAARAYRNADGYAVERVDDYSYQRPAATQAAGVYLTSDERTRLQAIAAGTTRKRVRSVRMSSWSVPQL